MKKFLLVLITLSLLFSLSGCKTVPEYQSDIIKLDLSIKPEGIDSKYDYLYDLVTVDDSRDYLAHPDSVLLTNGNILTFYPAGHGKGEILNSVSEDGGLSWKSNYLVTPESWKYSRETPTVYRLKFTEKEDRLVMISANPKWTNWTGDGFNASISYDEGASWTEFKKFYGKDSECHVSPIVAMSSLTRLKENGEFVDRWMGLFHDHNFVNYMTILSFDDKGDMIWSTPKAYFSQYRKIEKKTRMCEVEVIRSENGLGDELCLITRSNGHSGNKYHYSLISFSSDEGKTWSEPRELPPVLSGERHKAEYVNNRLVITFRSIERETHKVKQFREKRSKNWYSEGLVAWIGTYQDLKEGKAGQYRIKLAHTYLAGQTAPSVTANADTGYCGLVALADNSVIITSYGTFGQKIKDSNNYKTYIASKKIRLEDLDGLAEIILGK